MDVLLLSRLQFALTIMFHYLFPPLTIGLSVVMVYLEGMHLWTKDGRYHAAAKFWTGLFGATFALGVVTGIVMEFEFGTNWAAYSRYVGDVFGSALAAEGIFAFFLESGFLAVLLFGWDRVGPKTHFFATCMVCLGGMFSAVWIVIANSWQQTPAGFALVEREINGIVYQRAEITDFWAMLTNPSAAHRLIHVYLGSFVLGAFFVLSVSAWYLLKNRHAEFARRSFTGGLLLATTASLAQLVSGHLQAQNVAEHQPAKLAAFEGLYRTEQPAPLYLFGWPDDERREVRFGLAVPGGLSFLVHEDFETAVPGLDDLKEDYGEPPVWITFQTYHLMVAIGMLFIGATLLTSWWRWRGTLWEKKWVLRFYVGAVALAFLANEAGWVAAEVGRQPWVVYPSLIDGELMGGLRTSDALSEAVEASQVLWSIIMFALIDLLLFAVWVSVLHTKITRGPDWDFPESAAAEGNMKGLLDAAADRPDHDRSLTEAKDGGRENEGGGRRDGSPPGTS
ncbi:cytochrome ubiquinol oxidase subunit I [Alienimonas californiensis]|uniref:Cytochrome bd-I ubiquinol oxidase subunit 1 n=1 Tax=Alienimonas californiensis TaxID=2527989 RepID=A0A517P5R4_9PLAN|nr:cytochrome ubiquinol oxidase subunit I [Alienimonas californiensis]QDT14711.1 Cytochrome bd-I ubiquinol oxidase subunit 1 [Alienimonas californiensis]